MKTLFCFTAALFFVHVYILSQVPYQFGLQYTSGTTEDISDVYAAEYRSNQSFVCIGTVNDDDAHQNDSLLAIYKIFPDGSYSDPYVIRTNIGVTPKTFIAKDVEERADGIFAICGLVRNGSLPGGSSGFLMTMDTSLTGSANIYIYDSLLIASSLVYNPNDDYYVIVGQSYRDYYSGNTWDSIPSLIVVDGSDPTNILDGTSVIENGAVYDHGIFNDVTSINFKEYYVVGTFLTEDGDYFTDDILFSIVEINDAGDITNEGHILVNSNTDRSEERGRKIIAQSTSEVYICGESWDPESQQNPKKDIATIKITGSLTPSNIGSLTYDFREFDFNNDDNEIFGLGIDFSSNYYNTLAVCGTYVDDGSIHPYILHSYNYGVTNYASDFYSGTAPAYKLTRTFILQTSLRVLGFGWVDNGITGRDEILIDGDTLFTSNPLSCKSVLTVHMADPTPAKREIDHIEHTEGEQDFDGYPGDETPSEYGICGNDVFKSTPTTPVSAAVTLDEIEVISYNGMLDVSNATGEYAIYDRLGRTVGKGRIDGHKVLDITGLPSGIYIITFKEDHKSMKFIR